MITTDINYPYITENKNGIAIIEGTRMKITQLVAERLAYGWSPEEFHYQHPDITMGQIYSAFAYYADNEALVHSQIEAEERFVDEISKKIKKSNFFNRI